MQDLDAEIKRLEDELARRQQSKSSNAGKVSVENLNLIRQEEPVWQDPNDNGDEDYEEESYYEEEIIEEYSDDEWEEEIIEEEIIEDDDYEEYEVVDEEVVDKVGKSALPAASSGALTSATTANSSSSTAVGPASTSPSRRTWTPSYLRNKPVEPPAPAAPAAQPVVRKWQRPAAASVTPTPPPAPSGPSWATKQQVKLKKTNIPIITTSAVTAPTPAAAAALAAAATAAGGPPMKDGKPIPRKRGKIRPPPGAGVATQKSAPPPGLEADAKKGPRIKIINWGGNRRTNSEIQAATNPNFKPGTASANGEPDPVKVKRNYVIPKNVRPPPGANGDESAAGPLSSSKGKDGGPVRKRRTIPDLPISPPGQETFWELMLGTKLIANSKLQKKNTIGCMKDQELIGLYFGCQMKPECKYFHPRLQDFYFNAASQQQNLEIVYISSDRSLNDFKDVYARMPYLALPGGTASIKNKLSQSLKIIDQPTLVILDDEGMVVTVDAAQQVLALERGNTDQAVALIERWKKTRPVSMEQVQRDFALQHGKLQRGVLYWQE